MTIYDIAKQAGVSASTVSRVINQKPGISEKTRQKVQKLLDENNYTPDVTARGLVMQSSRTIGILIEDIRVSLHTDAVYNIEQELMGQGYTCITISTGRTLEKKLEAIRLLEQRRADGVIMIGSMFGEEDGSGEGPICREMKNHLDSTPVVIVNGELKLPNLWCIISDEERGIEDSVGYLVKKGRKQIVYLTDVDTPSNKLKLGGYRTGCLKYGENMPVQIYQAPGEDTNPADSVERGSHAAQELLKRFPGADAILCATDMLAVGCIRGLIKLGKRVPEDVAVMGVDNSLLGQLVVPALTTLDNRLPECAMYAAVTLLKAMEGGNPSRKILIPAEIIPRESA